jgi:hypothetical protein
MLYTLHYLFYRQYTQLFESNKVFLLLFNLQPVSDLYFIARKICFITYT